MICAQNKVSGQDVKKKKSAGASVPLTTDGPDDEGLRDSAQAVQGGRAGGGFSARRAQL